jgi:5-methylcytosine-specific restriction endonuclease McrA
MSRFCLREVLFGTFVCSVLASSPETTQAVDREELRVAVERYVRNNPYYIPDLRTERRGWDTRTGRRVQRCLPCDRDTRGRIRRSPVARREFRQEHPCPATDRTTGACPGYVIDHIVPLKRGGADNAENMQWQSTAEAAAKDRWE